MTAARPTRRVTVVAGAARAAAADVVLSADSTLHELAELLARLLADATEPTEPAGCWALTHADGRWPDQEATLATAGVLDGEYLLLVSRARS